ncbi:hypothetical protein Droror1_Dr00020427 [Drosera rotundifolia]
MEKRKERKLAAMAGSRLCSRPDELVLLALRLWRLGCCGICHSLRKERRLIDLDEVDMRVCGGSHANALNSMLICYCKLGKLGVAMMDLGRLVKLNVGWLCVVLLIGLARFGKYEIYILPPDGRLISGHEENSLTLYTSKLAFRETESLGACSDAKENFCQIAPQLGSHQRETYGCTKGRFSSSTREAVVTIEERVDASDAFVKASSSECGVHPSISNSHKVVFDSKDYTVGDNFTERNYVRTDLSWLKTLSQSYSSWVDNARDVEEQKLNISVETVFYKKAGAISRCYLSKMMATV